MSIVPNSMLGTAAQSIQSNPMFLMQEMMRKFEAAKLASLQAGQERTAQYQQSQEQRATDIERAGEKYATPSKWGKADYAMTAASLILPIIGALLPQGKGMRGQRAKASQQQALTGLGQGLGAVQQYRLGREEAGRERQYTGEMKGIEHLSGLADMSLQSQERQAATQLGAAGKQAELGMRGLGVAAQYQKAMQPKGTTWGDLKTGRFGELSSGEQKDALYPGLEPTGQLSGLQRGNYALKLVDLEIDDILIKANQKYQALDKGLRERLGVKLKYGSIEHFSDLENIAARLAQGGVDKKDSWFTGDYAADSTLQGLVDDYNEALQRKRDLLKRLSGQGGQTGLGQGLQQGGTGETPLTPEEKAELEARRRQR